VGELKKLGVAVSKTSVAKVLRQHRHGPTEASASPYPSRAPASTMAGRSVAMTSSAGSSTSTNALPESGALVSAADNWPPSFQGEQGRWQDDGSFVTCALPASADIPVRALGYASPGNRKLVCGPFTHALSVPAGRRSWIIPGYPLSDSSNREVAPFRAQKGCR
jgi:hypothetical protein